MRKSKSQKTFKKLGIASLISVYLVILAGGIVRSTGSGMGCPDWPKCFGSWVPPIEESQLPDDYKETFREKRHKKNLKLAGYLQSFGFKVLANQILNEETDIVNLKFNVKKTYIEYINRLLGVITGILFFLTFIFSFSYIKKDKVITILSFVNLILVGIQGWIGSLVVSTDLLPWMVTIHMLLTFLLIALLIYILFRVPEKTFSSYNHNSIALNAVLVISLFASLLQVCFGTQVREAIDEVAKSLSHMQRELWIDKLGFEFYLHRSFSWFILILNFVIVYLIVKRFGREGLLFKLVQLICLIVVMEIVTGVAMSYLSIPALLQPIHLFLATVIFGFQYLAWLIINFRQSTYKFTF